MYPYLERRRPGSRRDGRLREAKDGAGTAYLIGVCNPRRSAGAARRVAAGVFVAQNFRDAALPHGRILASAGVVLFVAGLLLRWWAIITLGRFFTVDVTIEKDHELVEHGPFRIVRHPSYTGVLLAFVGFGLSLGNWAALLVILLPIGAAFIHRMNVEENALSVALGRQYTDYMRRTKRLVPFVY